MDLKAQVFQQYQKALPNQILGFFFEHRPLSNFHIENFVWEQITWTNSENAYQAAKTDKTEWIRFSKMTPSEGRKQGQLVKLRADWDQVKIDIMRSILLAKFTQCPEAQKVLLSTGTAHLEESNWWKDSFWGTYNGKGQNQLGKALMDIRANLYIRH